MWKKSAVFLPLGVVFGFLLSRAGATTYDHYAGLFLFRDWHLLWVIAIAALLGAVAVTLMKRFGVRTSLSGETVCYTGKPYRKTLIPGAVLFGAGWGLAGACPGTALVMLGEGKLGAAFTIVGIGLGTYLYESLSLRPALARNDESRDRAPRAT